jgi:hypothetical protein
MYFASFHSSRRIRVLDRQTTHTAWLSGVIAMIAVMLFGSVSFLNVIIGHGLILSAWLHSLWISDTASAAGLVLAKCWMIKMAPRRYISLAEKERTPAVS